MSNLRVFFSFFFYFFTDDIIKLNKKEERKQYSPKMKRGLQQNRTQQFRTPGSKWGIQQQKGGCNHYAVTCQAIAELRHLMGTPLKEGSACLLIYGNSFRNCVDILSPFRKGQKEALC